jgi:hypothetical protein
VKYTVVWAADAEEKLAAIWANASDREAIADAANTLDGQLARDPVALGESRPNEQRIAHCLPLGIRFQVIEDDRLVRVLTAWLCRRIDK